MVLAPCGCPVWGQVTRRAFLFSLRTKNTYNDPIHGRPRGPPPFSTPHPPLLYDAAGSARHIVGAGAAVGLGWGPCGRPSRFLANCTLLRARPTGRHSFLSLASQLILTFLLFQPPQQ